MSAVPDDIVEFESTEEGLMVWMSHIEERALGVLLISSGWLHWAATDKDLAKLQPAERDHVEDVIDRLRRARGEPHPMDSQPDDDF